MSSAEADTPNLLSRGAVVDGRYRVDAVLGKGGMSCVYQATHIALGQTVALKVACPILLAMPGMAARFIREARAATQLRGEHVARVFDVGTTPSGTPYMAMEYLDGRDLRDALHEDAPLAVDVAIDYVLQACQALAEVHGRGMVHRDLKPANLFITYGPDGLPSVKVIDFGISRTAPSDVSGDAGRLTSPQAIMGTPRYMAPEQMHDAGSADARSDVWSLGAVLYELLTGDTPFEGDGLLELMLAATEAEPVRPSKLRDDVPSGLDEIVLRCLRPEPSDRFANVAELADALAPFGDERAVDRARDVALVLDATHARANDATDRDPRAVRGDDSASRPKSASRRSRSLRRRNLALYAGFVAAILCAVTIGATRQPQLRAMVWPQNDPEAAASAVPGDPVTTVTPDVTPMASPQRKLALPAAAATGTYERVSTAVPGNTSIRVDSTAAPEPAAPEPVERPTPAPAPTPSATEEPKLFEERR